MWSRYSKFSLVSVCGIGITAGAFCFVAAPGAIVVGVIGLAAANYSIDNNFLNKYATRVGEDVAKKLQCSLRLYSDYYNDVPNMSAATKIKCLMYETYAKGFGMSVSRIIDDLDRKHILTDVCDVKKIEAMTQFTILPKIFDKEPDYMQFFSIENKKLKVNCFYLMQEIEKSIHRHGGFLSLFKRPLAEQVVHYLEKEGKISTSINHYNRSC